MVPVSTFYAAIICLVAAVALFSALGLSTGWAIFAAVVLPPW